jgi:hypothetical protein
MREIRQSGSEGGVAGNSHPYPYNPGCSHLFCSGGVPGLALGACWRWGLRGIGPSLAGKLGGAKRAGWGKVDLGVGLRAVRSPNLRMYRAEA